MAKVDADPTRKKIHPGQRRYIAKQSGEGRSKVWGVYDQAKACWPITGPEWGGNVQQSGHDESSAWAEADRLEGL